MNPAKTLAGAFTLAVVGLTIAKPQVVRADSTWTRQDVSCPAPSDKEKTYCYRGGNEQCTAQYCNGGGS